MTEMNDPSTDLDPINISDRAVRRVQEIGQDDGRAAPILRVYVQGGGCSGFSYGFQLESEVDDDDISLDKGDVKVLVDPMSLQYLLGAKIDYIDDLMGARFVVSNPNASTTCGCGSSFSI